MTLLRAAFVSLRPHQWTKNLLVFAALAFSKHLFEADAFMRTLLAFAIFCGLSGAVYLVNDVADVERDRLHPRKKLRPVASGLLGTRPAVAIAAALAVFCLGTAPVLGLPFLACAATYLALNLAYSFHFKNAVILDVIAISLGFVLRASAGAMAISVRISDWLLVCTLLLALFLALSKRRHELVSLSDGASGHRAILAESAPTYSTR